jgi:hypothetical protein
MTSQQTPQSEHVEKFKIDVAKKRIFPIGRCSVLRINQLAIMLGGTMSEWTIEVDRVEEAMTNGVIELVNPSPVISIPKASLGSYEFDPDKIYCFPPVKSSIVDEVDIFHADGLDYTQTVKDAEAERRKQQEDHEFFKKQPRQARRKWLRDEALKRVEEKKAKQSRI